jgi:hypothetical protein
LTCIKARAGQIANLEQLIAVGIGAKIAQQQAE